VIATCFGQRSRKELKLLRIGLRLFVKFAERLLRCLIVLIARSSRVGSPPALSGHNDLPQLASCLGL
jgi:hypothetical protein